MSMLRVAVFARHMGEAAGTSVPEGVSVDSMDHVSYEDTPHNLLSLAGAVENGQDVYYQRLGKTLRDAVADAEAPIVVPEEDVA